jgi:hypothetical protein
MRQVFPVRMSRRFSTAVPLLLSTMLLATACGDDSDGTTNPSSVTIQSSQTTATIVRGGTITVPVTLTRTNFNGTVTLTAEGLPTGVTVTFNPTNLTGTGTAGTTSTATITASNTATTGTSNITFKVSGTGVAAATSPIALTVNAPAGITLLSGSTTALAAQGSSASVPIIITRNGDFTGAVNLVAEGLPSGVTATFAPSTIASGARVTTLTFNAASNATAGPATITIRATGAGITEQTQTLNFTVNSSTTAGFGVSATPAAILVTAGQSASTALSLSRQASFAGNVQFTLEGAPVGVTATIAPNPVTANTANVNIVTTAATAPGVYQLTLRGTSTGAADRTVGITLIVTAP